jgi:hypothetical protein
MTVPISHQLEADDPAPLVEFLAYAYVRRRRAAVILIGIMALAFAIAAVLPSYYRATSWLAILPSPEFTVRQDAGSHAVTSAVLALDQVMKAESEILQSDELHEQTMLGMAADSGRPASMAAASLYADLDPQNSPSIVEQIGHALIHYAVWVWRNDTATHADGPMDTALRRFSRKRRRRSTRCYRSTPPGAAAFITIRNLPWHKRRPNSPKKRCAPPMKRFRVSSRRTDFRILKRNAGCC